MNPAERLADYLAGSLDADARAALEAELARDDALRAQLAAMRRADAALAALTSPAPPAGFEERLAAAIGTELARTLADGADVDGDDATPDSPDSGGGTDELARRRARREHRAAPRWAPRIAGVAAGVVVLAGAGLMASNIPWAGGGDAGSGAGFAMTTMAESSLNDATAGSADTALRQPAPSSGYESLAGDAATDPATPVPDGMGGGPDEDGPVLVEGDRDLDLDSAGGLLDLPHVVVLAGQRLAGDEARTLAAAWADALRPVAATSLAPPTSGGEGPADGGARRGAFSAGACVDTVSTDAIPAHVESGLHAGRPALAFVVLREDEGSGVWTRREVLVLDGQTCETLLVLGR